MDQRDEFGWPSVVVIILGVLIILLLATM